MATEKLATYKRYNGADWDTIYFKTKWSQVIQDASNGFFMTSGHTINGKSWTGLSKTITLAGADINYTGETGTYVTKDTTLDANIKALDAAVLAAKNAIPSGVLTSSNYAETLGSVYQPLNDELTNLTSLSSATASGLVFRVAGSTNLNRYGTVSYESLAGSLSGTSAGSNQLAKQSTTVNGKPLSANITLSGDDIAVGSGDTATIAARFTSVQSDISSAISLAEGKTKTYVIDPTNEINSGFNVKKSSTVDDKDISDKFECVDGTIVNPESDLKVGDIVLTTGSGIKDWFYSGKNSETGYPHFYQIDSDTPDLTVYLKKADLQTGYSASNGSNPVTGKSIAAALDTSITGASMTSYGVTLKTGGTFKAPTVTVTATSDSTPSASNTNIMNGKSVYSYVSARATKIFYADTVPTSGMITGDICIEY